MPRQSNPFVYDQANMLDDNVILSYFIDDYNNSRLIQSRRNVFLVGERGSGKSMTLIYNSARLQLLKAQKEEREPEVDLIGVLVPCNTPLTLKSEHELLEKPRAAVLSEHYFVLSILYETAATLALFADRLQDEEERAIRDGLSFIFGFDLKATIPVFEGLKEAVQKEVVKTQRRVNEPGGDSFYSGALSFGSAVLPFIRSVRNTNGFGSSHLMFMIDDAHDLNEHQVVALNSWISYRDRSLFSFKVAVAKVGRLSQVTNTGGSILEGHDFIKIDMEQPFQYEESNFGRLAERIVARRLERLGIDCSPGDFFPEDERFIEEVDLAAVRLREEAEEIYSPEEAKKKADFVYKRKRIAYFRSRDPKANLPVYAGFSTLVYLSTGVIRNLLEPCWWMYDDAWSRLPVEEREQGAIKHIPSGLQSQRILDRSKEAWDRLRNLEHIIEGCTIEMREKVYNLFDQLAIYFRQRLLSDISEPAAISFSISDQKPTAMGQLDGLISVARKAQLLYVREGPAKVAGQRELYYVPNRILWPIRGLDPHGQHARASIRAMVLLMAAEGRPIGQEEAPIKDQKELFNE